MSVRKKSLSWQIGALALVAVLAGASFFLVKYLGREAEELAKKVPETTTKPASSALLIELVGEENVTVPLGGAYVELGATAKAKDGTSLTEKITTIGADKINTFVPGVSYPVEYAVTDKDGNSITATRRVIIDGNAEVIADGGPNARERGVVLQDDPLAVVDRLHGDLDRDVDVDVNGLRGRSEGGGGYQGGNLVGGDRDGDVDLGALAENLDARLAVIEEEDNNDVAGAADRGFKGLDVERSRPTDAVDFDKRVREFGEGTGEPAPGKPAPDADANENQRSSGGGTPPNPVGNANKAATGGERATLRNPGDGEADLVSRKRQEVAPDANAQKATLRDKSDASNADIQEPPPGNSDSKKPHPPTGKRSFDNQRPGGAKGEHRRNQNQQRRLELAEKALSYVAFNTPEKVPYGEPSYIQFVLDPTKNQEEITKLVKEKGPVATARIKITREMEVTLTGEKFDITAIAAPKQMIAFDDTTEWKWSIVPREPGKHRVHLVVHAIIRMEGREMRRSKSFDRYIEIEVTGFQQTVIFMQNNWPWLALGFVPLVFLGPVRTSKYWRNRKAGKELAMVKHDETRRIDVFVSYSSKDRAIVLPLVKSLHGHGYNVWVDHGALHGASQWSEQIVSAIENTEAFLLISSPNSFESHNVVKETSLASERRKHVIPVFIEDAEIPQSLQYQLAGLQRVNYSEHDHKEGVQRIVDALTKLGVTGSEQAN